ncbi:DUF6364 family protein [Aquirufa regiilacus]|uniref:DUF6364 family protein n=1 Tax=Aquirufa regiilacus TaxID=3024868 RepID=A0ABU3TNT5_9BACT|nr:MULTISPECIES: DUF6364 family protein [unclassified Aquirufa]MDT8888010.1 DUF6364 family protein [Aquirufa sp. LEPPI-3A]MDU0807480.1 DUF6364 family protein [Aquirufa sp. LEOWEIH-7C]
MDTKLTLKLDHDVIEKAKTFAKAKNTSLSKLIENYLRLLVDHERNSEVNTLVKSLSGVLHLTENFNHKSEYQKYITSKYKS